jgi:hypothetical protein
MIETMTLSINYYYRVDSVEGVKNRSTKNKMCPYIKKKVIQYKLKKVKIESHDINV